MTKIAHSQREQATDDAAAERNDERLTRTVRATATAGADVVRDGVEVAQSAAEAAGDALEATRALAEESPQFGRDLAELLREQTREGVDTFSAFARAVNWSEVAQAQGKLVTSSFLQISRFNARYGELLLRGMTAVPALKQAPVPSARPTGGSRDR